MPALTEYFRSVEWVWAIWLVSVFLLTWLTVRAMRMGTRYAPRDGLNAAGVCPSPDDHAERDEYPSLTTHGVRFARAEDGAAYSLAYVMVLPFYVFLVCLTIESTMLLLTKIGSVQAAYAAARSEIVYRSLDPMPERRQERTRRAAVRAMVPFSSALAMHAAGAPTSSAIEDARHYYEAAHRYSSQLGADVGLKARYYYADRALSLDVHKASPAPDGLVNVTLNYYAPLHVPGVGRLFGIRCPWGGSFYVAKIVTKVSLPDEAPASDNGQLGIRYDVSDANP